MKRPAVFFDRDNTLIVSDGYLGDPDGVVLVDGAAELVARIRRLGYAAVTFSNQSGVARGLFTEQDVHRVNSKLDEMLLDHEAGAVIDRHEFCPHHPEAVVPRYRQASEFRKPSPGMIYQAARQLGLDLTRSWVVGDAPRDIEAGRAAGCRTILFRGPALPPSSAASEPLSVEPDFVAGSLKEVGDLIENNPLAEETAEPALVSDVVPPAIEAEDRAEAAAVDSGAVESAPLVEPVATEPVVLAVEPPADEPRVEGDEPRAEPVDQAPPPDVQEQTSPESSRGLLDLEDERQASIALEPVAAVHEPVSEHGDQTPFADDPARADRGPASEQGERTPLADDPIAAINELSSRCEEQTCVVNDPAPPPAAITEPGAQEQEPGSQEQEQPLAAPVEAAVLEEPAAVSEYRSPQLAEEQAMDDTSTPGPAPASGADSEGAVRRRSPPAVILAAKAAREAARNSAPDASAEVLREVARNAAREAAMGITRDFAAAAPTADPSPEPVVAADEASVQEPLFESTTDSPRSAEPAAPAYQPAPDQADETGAAPAGNLNRLEELAEQILMELRQRNDGGSDFSVSKLMAGITMVLSVALLVYAYLYKDNPTTLMNLLLLGLMLQAITISLLIMGRQK
jgi:D-glycero-D-manno-heptose 1,7-bisphosphate phosphatase